MKSSKQSRLSQDTVAPPPDTLLPADQEIGDEHFLEGEVRRVDYQGQQGNSQSTTPDQAAVPVSKKQRHKKQREREVADGEQVIRTDNGL